MRNLFINSDCNLRCDYCFVSKDFGGAPPRLDRRSFDAVLGWLKDAGATTVAILGGEPTLHPDLLYFLSELWRAGVCPVLFTNALFPPDWAEPLAALTVNIVVNYNGPEIGPPAALELRESNLGRLAGLGGRISLSKNLAPGHLDYGYLIEGAKRFGVKTIRYDLSRPRADLANAHFGSEGSGAGVQAMLGLARAAAAEGLATGLDCCLPACLMSPAELPELQALSSPFESVCRPSLDILPDLSVIHCWPLPGLRAPRLADFFDELDLLGHMAGLAQPVRAKARSECGGCSRPPSACQGGCLARPHSAARGAALLAGELPGGSSGPPGPLLEGDDGPAPAGPSAARGEAAR
jgi:hypothetical protein